MQTLEDKNIREELVKLICESRENKKNSKYGEFIIQANKVQIFLIFSTLRRSYCSDERLKKDLERLKLGNLIRYFRICAKNSSELNLIKILEKYKESRNSLAHKMFGNKKLEKEECMRSIEDGKKIIKFLKDIIKN